jgi:IS1 transposase
VVVRAQKGAQTLGLAGAVPGHAPGGGLRYRQPQRSYLSEIVGTYPESLSWRMLLQRFLGSVSREVIPTEQHVAVGKDSGETAHVERWNNTLRQRLGRFVGKSLSFSKSEEMHEVCLRLFLHSYNLALISYD